MDKLEIYTDGGFRPNNRIGVSAFAVVQEGKLVHSNFNLYRSDSSMYMELKALENALRYLLERRLKVAVDIYSDNMVLIQGMSHLALKWRTDNWMKKSGKGIIHKESWLLILNLASFYKHPIKYNWVPAHNGVFWNEYVDQICDRKLGQF